MRNCVPSGFTSAADSGTHTGFIRAQRGIEVSEKQITPIYRTEIYLLTLNYRCDFTLTPLHSQQLLRENSAHRPATQSLWAFGCVRGIAYLSFPFSS